MKRTQTLKTAALAALLALGPSLAIAAMPESGEAATPYASGEPAAAGTEGTKDRKQDGKEGGADGSKPKAADGQAGGEG